LAIILIVILGPWWFKVLGALLARTGNSSCLDTCPVNFCITAVNLSALTIAECSGYAQIVLFGLVPLVFVDWHLDQI
jgi:hypothetical protein